MKKMILTAFAAILMGTLFAQNPQNYFRVKNQFTGQILTTSSGQPDSVWTVKLEVTTVNISNFKKVHVKMKAENKPEVVNRIFNLSGSNTNLPSGMSFTTQGNKIFVTLGNYSPDFWIWTVKLEDKNGNVTEIPIVQ